MSLPRHPAPNLIGCWIYSLRPSGPAASPTQAQDGDIPGVGPQGPGGTRRRDVGRQEETHSLPQVRGLPAHRVRRVPLLQGHEEVRRAGTHEAVVHHEAVRRGTLASIIIPHVILLQKKMYSRHLRCLELRIQFTEMLLLLLSARWPPGGSIIQP